MDEKNTEIELVKIGSLPEPWREVVGKLQVRSEHEVNKGNGWEFVRNELLPKVFEVASKIDQINGIWEGRYKQNMVVYLMEVKEKLADFNGGAMSQSELERMKGYCEYLTKHPLLGGGIGEDLITYRTFLEEGDGLEMPKAA